MLKNVPFTYLRGGTSKAVFFEEKDIPPKGDERDRFLLRIMGSPDKIQIDGLGGAMSITSKVAIISPPQKEDSDVDFTFANVAIDRPVVDWEGTCGNISAAVGPYAIEAGYVQPKEPMTLVRFYNTNTKKIVHSEVLVKDGQVVYEGDFAIDGVPGHAAPINLHFFDPEGSVTGHVLPTGHAIDVLDVPGIGNIEVSIVDVSNPLVFIHAESIGMKGTELPAQIDASELLLNKLEAIRGAAALKLGFIQDWKESAIKSPAVPKMTIVTAPCDYIATSGKAINKDRIDIVGRMMSMQKAHKTYAGTGALCTAAAAAIKGSIVNRLIRKGMDLKDIKIGHPGGIINVGVEVEESGERVKIKSVSYFRTARLLMKGVAYYPA